MTCREAILNKEAEVEHCLSLLEADGTWDAGEFWPSMEISDRSERSE